MTREEQAAIINRAYALMERTEEMLAEPRVPPPAGWQPRQVERPRTAPEPEPERRSLTDAMASRLCEEFARNIAADKRDKAAIAKCLDVLADEAGAQCGKLQKQIGELNAQIAEQKTAIDEMRGEIALLRGLAAASRSSAAARRIVRSNNREQDANAAVN